MKKLFLFVALLAFVACNMEKGYTIQGTLSGDESVMNTKAYLFSMDKENPFTDTVDVVKGAFEFKGKVASPDRYVIMFDGVNGRVFIYLENAPFKVTADASDLQKAIIEGGQTQTLLNLVTEKRAALEKALGDTEALIKEYRDPNTLKERKEEIVALFDKVDEAAEQFKDSLVKANPFTTFSLISFQEKVEEMDIAEAEKLLNDYKAKVEFAGNKILLSVEKSINTLKGLQIGAVAPEFKMKNPDGVEIALSDIYKNNKITMIDFWAGWCNPCRQFNPKLVEIYKKYHKKGFEILGVSMDRDRNNWLKAIKDDHLTWPQVSDVNFWDCEPVRLYAVRYIPQNAFVDQEGKIIGRKLSEEEIVSLLEEHLK